jgi:hypothetical protein
MTQTFFLFRDERHDILEAHYLLSKRHQPFLSPVPEATDFQVTYPDEHGSDSSVNILLLTESRAQCNGHRSLCTSCYRHEILNLLPLLGRNGVGDCNIENEYNLSKTRARTTYMAAERQCGSQPLPNLCLSLPLPVLY